MTYNVFGGMLNLAQPNSGGGGSRSLQNTENEANLLLPLGTKS